MRVDAFAIFLIALVPLLDENQMPTDQVVQMARRGQRLNRFKSGNDRIWGEGNWIQCPTCPRDSMGFEVFHHKNAHA